MTRSCTCIGQTGFWHAEQHREAVLSFSRGHKAQHDRFPLVLPDAVVVDGELVTTNVFIASLQQIKHTESATCC